MNETRRDLLRLGAGAIAAASVAGCTGSLGSGASDAGVEEGEGTSATASFFTLYDFARNVGGDALAVENAVPAGQHGHGWEPQSDITADVVERDAFVHLGIEGFQRWADEIVAEIEANHDDVTPIPAAAGIELSEYDDRGRGEDDHEHAEGDHHQDGGHGHDEEEGHDHGGYDPHLWVDPVRSRQAVENVRDGLVEADEGNAEIYEENASAYLADLESLDRRFEEALAEREYDVVVVAGHDSYGYLAERYGFEIHTPQGVSPDSEASPGEIAETVDLIEREGIEYVLYDHFDGDTLARTIVEEAETATDVVRLSPAESVTEEWRSEGLDYVGQMEEINLPSLRRALGAE